MEECLRLEGPIKSTFRLALRDAKIAGVDVPAEDTAEDTAQDTGPAAVGRFMNGI